MPHILTIALDKQSFSAHGGRAPQAPATEPENVATLWVDWDNKKWNARTNIRGFATMFGNLSQGIITTNHGFFFGDADQMLAAPSGNDLIVLQQFGLDPQAKLSGIAAFGTNPNAKDTGWGGKANAYLYFTHFWRKLSGKDMTPRERVEEMSAIAMNKYGSQIGSDAVGQVKSLATAESLAAMGGVLLLFASATALGIAGLVAAMRALCGAADVATNWVMYKPYWDQFVDQVHSGANLDAGAQALASLLGGLLGYGASSVVGGKASEKASAHIQKVGNAFANAVRGHSPERWRQVAEQGVKDLKEHAVKSGDPYNTKIDPTKPLSPEERVKLSQQHPELLESVRKAAIRFGFPPDIAAGYAKLAFQNGWTIIARTSKKASIPHHALGAEQVTAKSLFVKYKIDPEHGVIVQDGMKNIEQDFYAKDSYAAHQLEAIYYAENPNAPKGSFKITDQLMHEFKAAHKFEFRKIKMGNKDREVLFHNGKMVIGDVDLMGIYVMKGHDLVPLPQWMLHNDAKFLQDFVNRSVGGVPMSQHGQQDVGRNSHGKPFRSPDADERYALFTPDLQLKEVKSTSQLENLYRTLHILWPYETYQACGGMINNWCVSTARRRKAAG